MLGRLLITLLAGPLIAGPASGIVKSGDQDDLALRVRKTSPSSSP